MKTLFVLIASCVLGFQSSASAQVSSHQQSLIGSVWSAGGQPGTAPLVITYLFRFNQDKLSVEATCFADSISGTMKSELATTYSSDGAIATLNSGVDAQIPAGASSCHLYLPASLEFHLEQDQVFLELNGKRKPSGMKRVNEAGTPF